MSDDYRDYIAAARTIRKANAMLGNGERCSWTSDDFFDLASTLAAEQGLPGRCPLCNKEVRATTSVRIAKHLDGAGKMCNSSGQWFHIAVQVTA